MARYLKCTEIIDYDARLTGDIVRELTAGMQAEREKAVALYYFVRDEIKHNPYAPMQDREHHKASATLARGSGTCEHKAVVLVALCRVVGIPARLGYVDIRDHLLSEKFRKMIGGDNLLIQHGYVEICVDRRWVHASPAYDLATCEKGGFVPVDFDGINDAKDSAYDLEGKRHIEHVKDHGYYEDFPWDWLVAYRQEWVERIGREWTEFTDNVRSHEV